MSGDDPVVDKPGARSDGVVDATKPGEEAPECGFQGLEWWMQLLAFVGIKDDEAKVREGNGAVVRVSPESEREACEAELRAQLDAAREKLESSNTELLTQLEAADGGLMEVWKRRGDLERENARLRMELMNKEEELELAQEALCDLDSCLEESRIKLHATRDRAKRAEAEVERLHEAMRVLQRQSTLAESAKSAIAHELVKAQTAMELAESDAAVLRTEVAFLKAPQTSEPKQVLVDRFIEAEGKVEHRDEPDGDIALHAVTPDRVDLRPPLDSTEELEETPRQCSSATRVSFAVERNAYDEADGAEEEDAGQLGRAPIKINGTDFKARNMTWTSLSSGPCTLPDHLKAWQEKRSSDEFVDPYQVRLARLESKMEDEHRRGASAALAKKKESLRPVSYGSYH